MWRHQLSAIIPVSLVTVIFFWIMGRSDHHSAFAFALANSERKFRRWSQGIEQKYLNSIGTKYICDYLGKLSAVIATIMRNRHADFLVGEIFLEVVSKTLCCHANRVFIHAISAHTH